MAIIRNDSADEKKYAIDDKKVSEGDNLDGYDRQLRTYPALGGGKDFR